MPLNLPIELVRQILVSLGPCSLDPDDRQDATQRTLYRCCLASKALKAVAQPLLYQAILLRREASVYKFASAVKANPELPQLVQTYKMPSSETWIDQSGYDTVRKVVTNLVKLRRLWMSGAHSARRYPSTRWADFAVLSNLSSLTMTAVRLSCSPPQPFRNLVQLACVDVYISEEDIKAILHPDITPNLRAAHLGNLYDPNGYYDNASFPIIPSSSLDRLDILQLSPSSSLPRLPYLFKPDSQLDNVAVQFYTIGDLPYLNPIALQHILLLWPSTIPYRQNIKPYRALTNLLRDLRDVEAAIGPHLRSISLPFPLRPVPGDAGDAAEGVGTESMADEAGQKAEDPDAPLALSQEPEVEFDDGDDPLVHDDEDDEDGEAGDNDSGDETEEEVRYTADPDEVGLTGRENWLRPHRSYDRSTYCPSPRTRRCVRQVLDFAAAHKSDVVWHNWDPKASNSMVCEDFWRYVREKKAGTWRG